MEFFFGTFERDWERRRAALLHALQMGEHEELDWDRPRRGGVTHLPGSGGAWNSSAHRQGRAVALCGTGRPMYERFAALARGSQPAVVKLASYGGGVRAAAMVRYASRSGELPVENERGERILGRTALAKLREDWEHLFDNRTASRDVGMFQVSATVSSAVVRMNGRDGFAREILLAGFGARRFVYAVEEKNAGEFEVSGVVVLRDPSGERLTADTKAAAIIQERFDNCDLRRDSEVRFRFRGYGNGVAFATARIRELVERVQGYVYDETGRTIENLEKAGDLVQKEWRRELHSRKGRDVMHLIVSARAGTHISAFHAAVRDFLGEQFDGHRYVFALHDPSDDPKERRQGGRRPHIHAHAIVTMRSERGERIVTGPQVFREWRASMAEKAREHGIEMEFTDRRDLASPPAYTRNQVRPVSYAGRTEHEGTSRAAQTRYGTKRANRHTVARSDRSIGYAVEAARFWAEVVRAAPGKAVRDFAAAQIGRLQMALRESQLTFGTFENSRNGKSLKANMVELGNVVAAGGNSMRTMTLTEFEAYEKRVEAVLATVEAAIEPVEKKDFDEVAKIAREVVSIRREYLELTERKPHDAGTRQQGADVRNVEWERAPAGGGSETVVHGNDRMPEEETARGARNRATRDGRDPSNAGADIERELANAARPSIAVNSRLRETAKSDQGRPGPMDGLERSDNLPDVEDERASVSDGSKSLPGPAGSTSTAASAESDQHAQQLSRSEINDQLEDSAIAQDAKREMRGRERREEAHDIRRLADERFNPKQQQVPRVRELEREVEQRRHHERDEQDR